MLDAFELALAEGHGFARARHEPLVIANIDWPMFRGLYEAYPRPFLSGMAGGCVLSSATRSLTGATKDQLTTWLREQVASVLGMPETAVDPQRPLSDFGFDSLMAVELKERLAAAGFAVAIRVLLRDARVATLVEELVPGLSVPAPRLPAPFHGSGALVVPAASCPSSAAADTAAAPGWLVTTLPRPGCTVRLICAPYAGGGVAAYRGWADELPPWLELAVVQLPGRGGRIDEEPYRDMDSVVEALTRAIAPSLDRPFAFFGHCLGALVLFEVAARLEKLYGLRPIHFFASGARAPQFYTREQLILDMLQYSPVPGVPGHEVDDDSFLELLRGLNFDTSAALFNDAELRRLLLPTVRADLALNNKYTYAPRPLLASPITAIGGRVDPYVSAHHVEGWRHRGAGLFRSIYRPGDHYFIARERQALITIVGETLERALSHKGASLESRIVPQTCRAPSTCEAPGPKDHVFGP